MDSFYEEFLFKRTHTPRNTAIALLLQGGLHRFYYGSAYQYQDIFMGPTDAIAHSDPVMLPLCSTGTVDILPVGSEYSRIEKTLQVTDVPESYQSLNVCTDPEEAGNCSKCYKCLRTLLTLEMTGKMSLYSDVFDFNTYDRNRRSYLLKVSEGGDPYRKELQEFAKETEYYIPLYIRAMSKLKLYTTYEYIKTYVSNRPVLASVAKKVLSYRTQL